ncbi:uncharacterized protein LODBEIA_P60460 [Lodderomyces beijingensis]|uniref:Uncharacterized protein n=1 Tax=Lodderomyces beijingensis TaxID=1775926 RepID=A0ABP0ZX30_9ASCO
MQVTHETQFLNAPSASTPKNFKRFFKANPNDLSKLKGLPTSTVTVDVNADFDLNCKETTIKKTTAPGEAKKPQSNQGTKDDGSTKSESESESVKVKSFNVHQLLKSVIKKKHTTVESFGVRRFLKSVFKKHTKIEFRSESVNAAQLLRPCIKKHTKFEPVTESVSVSECQSVKVQSFTAEQLSIKSAAPKFQLDAVALNAARDVSHSSCFDSSSLFGTTNKAYQRNATRSNSNSSSSSSSQSSNTKPKFLELFADGHSEESMRLLDAFENRVRLVQFSPHVIEHEFVEVTYNDDQQGQQPVQAKQSPQQKQPVQQPVQEQQKVLVPQPCRCHVQKVKAKFMRLQTKMTGWFQIKSKSNHGLLFDTEGLSAESIETLRNPGRSWLNYEEALVNKCVEVDKSKAVPREKQRAASSTKYGRVFMGFGYMDESWGFNTITKSNTNKNRHP